MNIFFLAAGLGTRLRPLTDKYPKPCVPFLNVPLGLYNFRFLNPLPIGACVANTFHLPEKVQQMYRQHKHFCEMQFSNESGHILGSAGGLKKAAHFFNDDPTIMMMNADEVFFPADENFLKTVYKQHLKNNNLATLITMRHPEAGKKFGAIWCDDNNVKHIGKQSSGAGQQPHHYIGTMLLHRDILKLIPDNVETNIFYDILIHELPHAKVQSFDLSCRWYETGNPTDFLLATRELLQNLDARTLKFINEYDNSELVTNAGGISLVSKAVHVKPEQLKGFNVISGRSDQDLLSALPLIENSVIFEREVLNADYFTQTGRT